MLTHQKHWCIPTSLVYSQWAIPWLTVSFLGQHFLQCNEQELWFLCSAWWLHLACSCGRLGLCWLQSGQNQFKICKSKAKPGHFCGPSKTAQCRFCVKGIKTHLRVNWSRTLEKMAKAVMWHSQCHVSKQGSVGIKLYRYYFSHCSCVLHQLKDILGTAGEPLCIQTQGLCTLWGCVTLGAWGGPKLVLLAGVVEEAENHLCNGWFLLGAFALECGICVLLWHSEVLRMISFPEITQIGNVLKGYWLRFMVRVCLSVLRICSLILSILYPLLAEVLKSSEFFPLISVGASPYSFELSSTWIGISNLTVFWNRRKGFRISASEWDAAIFLII